MADFDLVVRNGTVVSSNRRREVDIGIIDGRIASIARRSGLSGTGDQEIDATGRYVLPGVIDGHVHFREPGMEYKEDWLTGSRAAVMGGVTTVLEMPNTVPPTDTVERAREKLALAAVKAYCDFGIFGLVGAASESVAELAESGLIVGLKAFLGPTTGGLMAPDDDGLRHALLVARETGLRVAFHAEDESLINTAIASVQASGRSDARAHLDSRPQAAEVRAIERVARLLSETGAHGHVLHLSSAEGLAAVAAGQAQGIDMTAEATAHHCLLSADVHDSVAPLAKVNPPIRGEPHSSVLLAALAAGGVDAIGSDHAPHMAAERQGPDVWRVPSGFAGVEISLRLFLTAVNDGRLTLERLAYVTSEGPARAWGLWPRKGAVAIGSDADLTLVDLARPGVVHAADLHGRNNATPFEGWPTRGAAVATIVRGRIVMKGGDLLVDPGWGRAVERERAG